ncbi:MAG: hypothetical protein ABR498_00710 [Candidatus Dormibacteria bacterium]
MRIVAISVLVVSMLLAGAGVAHASSGSWAVVTSADTAPALPDVLNAVSCTRHDFCMAVGERAEVRTPSSPANQSLIERWNGTSWSIVSSPSPSQLGPNQPLPNEVGNYLDGVSCVDASFCVAVGYDYSSATSTHAPIGLVEHWDGSAWSLVDSPNPSQTGDFLDAVSCTSRDFCVAVGFALDGSSYDNLAEEWNGSAWSVLTTPDAPCPIRQRTQRCQLHEHDQLHRGRLGGSGQLVDRGTV